MKKPENLEEIREKLEKEGTPKACEDCPASVASVEGDDEIGYCVWYDCWLCDNVAADPGEKSSKCQYKTREEEE